jgi:hypothetical protein
MQINANCNQNGKKTTKVRRIQIEISFPCSTYPQISFLEFLQDEIGFRVYCVGLSCPFFSLSETFSKRVAIVFGILGRHPVFVGQY